MNMTMDVNNNSLIKYNSAVPSGNNTLGMNSASLRNSRIFGGGAVSVTRNQLSVNDISMVTDIRLQEE